MAQSGFTPISIYYSTTASAVPTAANLVPGELAINTNDGKLYYEDSSGVVQVLATKSTGSIGGSNTQVQFNNSGSLGGSSSFTWDGTTVTATKFAGALNGTVGATTASTGAFTSITASTTLGITGVATFSAGTLSLPAITTSGDTNTGIFFPAADTIAFTEGGAESMRIDSSGNLLVGTSSALSQVARATVVGSGNAFVAQCGNGTTALQTTNTSGTSTYYAAIFGNNGNTFSTCGIISVSGTTTSYNTTSSNTTGAQLNASGVTFPATQVPSADANTLDDYEEGTWTPAGGSLTNNATATYTKVGRIVYANFDISFPLGGAASQVQVSGMPFTALSPGGGGCLGICGYAVPILLNIERANTFFVFSTFGGVVINYSDFNGLRLIGTLVYTV